MDKVIESKDQDRCDRCGMLCNVLYHTKSGYSSNKLKFCDECLNYMLVRTLSKMGSGRLDTIIANGLEEFKKKTKIIKGKYGKELKSHREMKCDVCNCDSYVLLKLNKDNVCMYCMLDGLMKVSIAEEEFEKINNLGWPFNGR